MGKHWIVWVSQAILSRHAPVQSTIASSVWLCQARGRYLSCVWRWETMGDVFLKKVSRLKTRRIEYSPFVHSVAELPMLPTLLLGSKSKHGADASRHGHITTGSNCSCMSLLYHIELGDLSARDFQVATCNEKQKDL